MHLASRGKNDVLFPIQLGDTSHGSRGRGQGGLLIPARDAKGRTGDKDRSLEMIFFFRGARFVWVNLTVRFW